MPRKTIAIVGSRPDAVHKPADVVYFVNGSIANRHYYNNAYHHTHIIVGRAFLKSYQKYTGYEEDLATQWLEPFRNGKADNAIIRGSCNTDEVINTLRKYNYSADLYENITQSYADQMSQQVLGKKPLMGISMSFKYGLKTSLFIQKVLLKIILKKWFPLLKPDRDLQCYLRFSSGAFALLHAIHTYGEKEKFRLTGIGLNPYEYSYNFNSKYITDNTTELRKHLLADTCVINEASKIVSIETDDELISHVCGIPLISE